MEMINFLFALSWLLSLIACFGFGAAVGASVVTRQITETTNNAMGMIKGVFNEIKGG